MGRCLAAMRPALMRALDGMQPTFKQSSLASPPLAPSVCRSTCRRGLAESSRPARRLSVANLHTYCLIPEPDGPSVPLLVVLNVDLIIVGHRRILVHPEEGETNGAGLSLQDRNVDVMDIQSRGRCGGLLRRLPFIMRPPQAEGSRCLNTQRRAGPDGTDATISGSPGLRMPVFVKC